MLFLWKLNFKSSKVFSIFLVEYTVIVTVNNETLFLSFFFSMRSYSKDDVTFILFPTARNCFLFTTEQSNRHRYDGNLLADETLTLHSVLAVLYCISFSVRHMM